MLIVESDLDALAACHAAGDFLFAVAVYASDNRTDGIFDFYYKDDAAECISIFSKDADSFVSGWSASPEEQADFAIKKFTEELKFLDKQDASERKLFDVVCQRTKILVLRAGGEVAGFSLFTYYSPIPGRFYFVGEINALGVAKKFRRKGYGRKLLNATIKYLREKGCGMVGLITSNKNPGARTLYEGAGFEIEQECDISGDVRYRLKLGQSLFSLAFLKSVMKTMVLHAKHLGWHVKHLHWHIVTIVSRRETPFD